MVVLLDYRTTVDHITVPHFPSRHRRHAGRLTKECLCGTRGYPNTVSRLNESTQEDS